MALHFRRSDAADYVHISDPSVVAGDAEPLAGSWIPADGQPADATRVRVRPLDVFEFAAFASAETAEARIAACWGGVVSIDGQPADAGALVPEIVHACIALVAEISTRPLGRS